MSRTVPAEAAGVPWRKLDHKLLLVQLKWLLPPVFSTLFYGIFVAGHFDDAAYIRLGLLTGVFAGLMAWRLIQLLTTRYRLAGELLEVRSGLFGKHHRSIPCDRIRRVDLTRDPFHRVFGLAVVRIATAEHSGWEEHETKLEALPVAEAHRLRQALLRRAGSAGPGRAPADRVLLRMNLAWTRYAPLTSWGVIGVAILGGMALRVLDGFGIKAEYLLRRFLRFFGDTPVWQSVVLVAAALVVAGTVAATVVFVEEWWGYRLEREDDGTFTIHRGLLTTRTLSIDRRRLRGVEVVQPMFLRLGGGAHVAAVATGLQQAEENEVHKLKVLTPDLPAGLAHRLAGAVAGESPSPTEAAALVRHPGAALRRRCTRAALSVVACWAVLFTLGQWLTPVLVDIAWITAGLLVPFTAWLAVDAYRALGHAVHGRHIVTRYGTFSRKTVALERDGIIGWKIVRSPMQRWAGLSTVIATTAAGKEGAYSVRDVTLSDGVAFAEDSVPGLISPFVRRH